MQQCMGLALRMMTTQSLYGFGRADYPETPGNNGCTYRTRINDPRVLMFLALRLNEI